MRLEKVVIIIFFMEAIFPVTLFTNLSSSHFLYVSSGQNGPKWTWMCETNWGST